MKNKSLLPILVLAAMTLTACNLPNNSSQAESKPQESVPAEVSSETQDSSEEAPVSSQDTPVSSEEAPVSSEEPVSSEDPIQYGVAIANKAALQGEWYANTTRDLDVTLTPAANPLQELNKKNLTVTSSDPEVVAVTGLGLKSLKAGTATITVKYHDATDTVAVTILDNSAKAKYGVAHEGTAEDPFTNEDALAVAKHEKYEGEVYYVKGKIASFYNAPGSRTDGMVAYFLEPATAGGEKFEIYKCFKSDGSALTDDDIWVGGTATAYGAFTKYNDQYETSSAVFVSCEGNKPQARQTLTKTFAETLALGVALADGADSYDYIKFQGYVTKVSGNNYFLTATKGEAIVSGKSDEAHGSRDIYTNAIELYNAGTVSELAAILLDGAKVEVTMVVKNYHGTVENGLNLTKDDVTLIEAGQPWAVPTIKKTVAEAITVINALEDGKTTEDVYEIEGYITAVTTAWSAQYKNISYTIGDTADAAATAVITVFRSQVTEGTDGSALKAGDKVKVVGNLQKYVKESVMTPELTSGKTTLLEAGADLPVDVTDVDAASTAKTIAEIRAYAAADTTVLAKVTGVAENNYGNAKYGNFHLVDPATGKEITIYGGYTDATFTKTGANFATKTKTTAITSAIIGHTVTVYGTIGSYNGVGQLVDALVVAGDAYTGDVKVTAASNDSAMGTAAVSAASVAYGAEVTVTPTPASGYQVAKVEVKRASKTEEIAAVEGVYKFNAQILNDVVVTFEEAPAAGVAKATLKYKGTENKTGADFTGDALAEILNLDKTIFSVTYSKGGANEMALRTDGIRMYGLKQTANGNSFTVTAASGYNIKTIKITFDSDSYAECAVIKAGDTAVTAADGVYTINGSAFTVLDDNTSKTSNTQVRFQEIEIVYEEASAQPEIAQPTGTFFASAEITDAGKVALSTENSIVPIFITLGAENAVSLNINGKAVPATLKSYDKTNGNLVINTTAFGDLSMTYNPENGRLEKLSVVAATGVLKYDAGQSLRGNDELKYWNCDGETADLQAQFNRRSGNSSWALDSEEDRIVKNTEHAISGSALQVNKKSDNKERISLALKDFSQPFNARNISLWVYNDGESSVNLQAFYYKSANYGGYQQIFSGKACPAGQWTYISVGFTAADIYAFQFVIAQGTASTLIFDDICLF